MPLSQPKPDWAAVVFAAAANNDPFDDVDVFTARSEYVTHAFDRAAQTLQFTTIPMSIETVKVAAIGLISSQKLHVREFVEIQQGKISVCINVHSTEDDDMMFRALDMVQSALAQLDEADGIVYFGEELQFTLNEVADLILPI